MFANPAMNRVVVKANQKMGFVVFDLNGTQKLSAYTNEKIDITTLAKGVYIIRLNEKMKKLVIN